MKKSFLLLLFFSYVMSASGWEGDPTSIVTIDGLKYYLSSDTHEAFVYNGNTWTGELIIPSEVSYNDETYSVDGLLWKAFANSTELTKVMIPKSIVHIVNHAFSDNPEFGSSASPDYKNPFLGCTSLECIEVDEDNPSMCSVDGVLFSKDSTQLYSYPVGAKATSYKVLDGVTWIGMNTFEGSPYLKSVEMPNSVRQLCPGAFAGCTKMESIILSDSIAYISPFLFDNCKSLRIIDIPQNVSIIFDNAFQGTHLKELVFRGVLSAELSDYTFYSVDASMIIYAQRSEVPKFKKVFSGTVLPLEYYTAGLLDFQVEDSKSTSNLFDLQGRRIQGEPQHGVYIRNGKKIMK